MSTEFYWVAVVATIVLSSARLTRIAVYDKFPPALWLRNKYLDAADGSGWGLLALCGYCMAPWITALIVLWAGAADVFDGPGSTAGFKGLVWWTFNGIFAMAYLAASYVANDGDPGEDD